VFAVGCGGSDEGDKATTEDASLTYIQDKGELILGCDDEFPPMGFVDENGELTGFDIELAEAVCERLGVKLVAKPINWDSKELELESKNIDVIWNGYSIDADRNKKVEFTKPYLNNEQMVAVRADSEIKDFKGLEGKILGVQAKSAAETLVNEDKALVESLGEFKTYDTYQNALLDLKGSTRVDGVAGDKILLNYVMQQQPDTYKLLSDTLGKEYFGIGCRKDEVALRKAIDAALDALNVDGTIEKISKKWFGENIVIRDVPKLSQAELEG
jgi:polar amino acid transport system substrate-binding protein